MLFKKELMTIDPLGYQNRINGNYRHTASLKVVELPRSGKILVVDFYEGSAKNLLARFFSDGKTYLTCTKWPTEVWTKQNPRIILGDWGAYATEKAEKTARRFLQPEGPSYYCSGVLSSVDSFVSRINEEQRRRAWAREAEMQKRHFAMFPELPANLEMYCEDNIFDGYIFFKKLDKKGKRKGRCSHCKKRFTVERSVRSGQDTTCPKCGIRATYKAEWLNNTISDNAKICIAHKVNNQLLIRWASVYREFSPPDFKAKYVFWDYAYNLHLHTDQGDKLYFYKYMRGPYCYGYDWYRGKIGDICWDSTHIYTDNLNEVFGDRYYNVDLKAVLEGKRRELPFAKLLTNLKNIPATEYLLKLNMPLLAAGADYIVNPDACAHPSFTGVLGVSKQLRELYCSENVSLFEHSIIKAYGKYVSADDLRVFRKLGDMTGYRDTAIELITDMSFSRYVRYFTAQKTTHKGQKIGYLMMKYRDYLSMSKGLGVDLTHKSIRFPADCVAAHDQILPRFNEHKHEAENNIFKDAVSMLYEHMLTEYAKGGYCIVLPQKRSDLTTEGQSLNHCVGTDRYYKNHIAGTSMIFFIRKAENAGKPYFTMELDMFSYRIKQLYGFGDCSAPKEVRKFAEGYVKALASYQAGQRKTA